jgi:hypothetical protein
MHYPVKQARELGGAPCFGDSVRCGSLRFGGQGPVYSVEAGASRAGFAAGPAPEALASPLPGTTANDGERRHSSVSHYCFWVSLNGRRMRFALFLVIEAATGGGWGLNTR